MTLAARHRLLGLAIILMVALAFIAGMRWGKVFGASNSAHSGESQAAEPGSMAGCPMMGMSPKTVAAPVKGSADGCPMMGINHKMVAASEKSTSETTSNSGCSMPGMECGSMDGQGAKQAGAFPLDICPVTGNKLGTMGDPVIKNYAGREVRFCCGGCPAKFEKDLQANLKKLDAAIAKAQATKSGNHSSALTDNQGQQGDPQGVPVANHQDHANMR